MRNKLYAEKLCWPCCRPLVGCIRLRMDLQNHSSNSGIWFPFETAQWKRRWRSTSLAALGARTASCSATCSHTSTCSLPLAPAGLGCGQVPCRSTSQLLPTDKGLTKQPPGRDRFQSGLSPKMKDAHQTPFFPQQHQLPSVVFTAPTASRIWSMS